MSANTCQKHGKPFPCGKCRIESAKRPPQSAPLPVATDELTASMKALLFMPLEDSGPLLTPTDLVLAHTCRGKCQCKKTFTYAEAEEKVRVGDAEWWTVTPLIGSPYQVRSAIELKVAGKVGRISDGSSLGSSRTERSAEIGLKNRREGIDREYVPSNNEGGRPVARRDELEHALGTWPELSEIPFEEYELAVWLNSIECVGQDDYIVLASHFAVTLAEIDRIFKSADAKIAVCYNECRISKRGIFANWQKQPKDFRELDVAKIERALSRYRNLIATDEFKRLKPEEQVAINAWVQARQNYHEASITSSIPETTLQRHIKTGLSSLKKIASSAAPKSKAFAALADEIFASSRSNTLDDDSQNNKIISSGGSEINGRINSGKRREVGGRLVTEQLDTFERGFKTHFTKGDRIDDGATANRQVEFEDHSDESKP